MEIREKAKKREKRTGKGMKIRGKVKERDGKEKNIAQLPFYFMAKLMNVKCSQRLCPIAISHHGEVNEC